MRQIHIHIGPHKTGSSSIQKFLSDNFRFDMNNAESPVLINREETRNIANGLKKGGSDLLDSAISQLKQSVIAAGERDIIMSCEDFSGNLVGRGGGKRVYPELFRNIKLLNDHLSDLGFCKFYFFVRPESDWLLSVYLQNLKHRDVEASYEKFASLVKWDNSWDTTLSKVRQKFPDQFIEIPFPDRDDVSVVKLFIDNFFPELKLPKQNFDDYWQNRSPDSLTVGLLQSINCSDSSRNAKRKAREFVLQKDDSVGTGLPVDYKNYTSKDPRTGSGQLLSSFLPWPPSRSAPDDLPEELMPLWARTMERVAEQDQPNLLPRIEDGFSKVRRELVEWDVEFPAGNRQNMFQQEKILSYRFKGLPKLCLYNALAISYLRRSTPHTDHARSVFLKLWSEEYPILLATLQTRWLISTLQTFMDHGATEEQRSVGICGYFLSNTIKAYEAERGLEGHESNAVYSNIKPVTKNGFGGLDRFPLGNTDLMLNLLALALETCARDEVAGRVLLEFLTRLRYANSIFSRMDLSRIYHDIDTPGFSNCWSFFERPSTKP